MSDEIELGIRPEHEYVVRVFSTGECNAIASVHVFSHTVTDDGIVTGQL